MIRRDSLFQSFEKSAPPSRSINFTLFLTVGSIRQRHSFLTVLIACITFHSKENRHSCVQITTIPCRETISIGIISALQIKLGSKRRGIRAVSKIAHYLQEHLAGEVLTSESARNYFSTDASVFEVKPKIIVYPRNTSDVRKTNRFSWQLAERGKILPVTARGKGTDVSGAAIGEGIILVFPAHMNRLIELDTNKGYARVQPGIIYKNLQNTLHTHGQFIPPYPASLDYSTIGGSIANNTSGEKSIKYGATGAFVKELDVVLANGELIHTMRLSKRDINRKKGLTTFEGEIYRQLDGILTDNWDKIQEATKDITKNSSGYNLRDVKRKDGSFDLTPLFVGSQGTLGVITQATMTTAGYNPNTTLISAHFSDLESAKDAIVKLADMGVSALEMVDKNLLKFIHENNPQQLKSLVDEPLPEILLLIEFDDVNERKQKSGVKKAIKALSGLAKEYSVARDEHEREMLWKIRHSAAAVLWHDHDNKRAVPIIDDGIVPRAKFSEYVSGIYQLFEKYRLDVAIWGHAGDANLHVHPFLDLSKVGDRQKVFKIMDDYYGLVLGLGGSISGEHGDGRLRGSFLPDVYGEEIYELFGKVKKIFDPYGTMNPGVKMDVKREDIIPLLRKEYSVDHLLDHMPRS